MLALPELDTLGIIGRHAKYNTAHTRLALRWLKARARVHVENYVLEHYVEGMDIERMINLRLGAYEELAKATAPADEAQTTIDRLASNTPDAIEAYREICARAGIKIDPEALVKTNPTPEDK